MSEQKRAHVTWKGTNLDFRATMGSGYQVDLSSNASEAAGSPMEMLLAGVAGCTAVDVVSILQKMRQAVQGLEVSIEADRADTPPKVYTNARLHYTVHGSDVDPTAVAKAIQLSKEKYCSASVMFERAGVDFEVDFDIVAVEAVAGS